ncbi:MAG: glycosyltransferase family 39 protein [Elusimicrobia bacterium]|nr:glycosyltransferase family 39 protein [Elusimicrobiota bacterium]
MPPENTIRRLAWAAFAAAAAVRLLGIDWGLPHTYNADEPHLIHLAVSFGGGSLKPYAFKYPTLWPYLLSACYGLYFLLWSGFGLWRSISDFIGLYAWHPTGFYLIGRLLSAGLSLLAAAAIWRAERRLRPNGVPWAALLLLFSPIIVTTAQSAKPDCLMLFFACSGWALALEVYRNAERRLHWLCGAAFGLAMSSQYTALPVALALPLAHFFSPRRRPPSWLAEGLAACAAGFFAGAPYVLLDFPNFRAAVTDLGQMPAAAKPGGMLLALVGNIGSFAALGPLAGLAIAAGSARLWRRERGLAAVLLGPLLAYLLLLSLSPINNARYLLGGYPALALLAAEGLSWIERPRRPLAALLAGALALGPGAWLSLSHSLELILPDTRAQAEAWIVENIPSGTTVLLDTAHAAPNLRMVREQALELAQRTRLLGTPRWRLYQGMADTHPGGGYRLYRIRLSAEDLGSEPRHTLRSQAETATADVRAGLGAARALKVDYVVASSIGAERSPELQTFFAQLAASGRLLRTFSPSPGKIGGPTIRIYALRPDAAD